MLDDAPWPPSRFIHKGFSRLKLGKTPIASKHPIRLVSERSLVFASQQGPALTSKPMGPRSGRG
jgi:hypothetical protein